MVNENNLGLQSAKREAFRILGYHFSGNNSNMGR